MIWTWLPDPILVWFGNLQCWLVAVGTQYLQGFTTSVNLLVC